MRRPPSSIPLAILAIVVGFFAPLAHARDRPRRDCIALALRDVEPECCAGIVRRGTRSGDVVSYSKPHKPGLKATVRFRGGYAYPADAFKLLNCRVKDKPDATLSGDGYDFYEVEGR